MRGRIFTSAIWLCLSSASAAADEQPICADRPSKSTGACTVPEGRFQVETGLVDWSHDHSSDGTMDFTTIGSSLLKYGVSDRADVEVGVTPLELLRAPGERESGFGDMLLRVKYRLTAEDAAFQAALDPFVKLPTANHRLGNGKVEAGLGLAASVPLGKTGLTIATDPELDLLADEDGHGRHAAMVQVLNIGASTYYAWVKQAKPLGLGYVGAGLVGAAIVGTAIAASGPGYYYDGYRRCGWVRQFDAFGNYIGRVRTCGY